MVTELSDLWKDLATQPLATADSSAQSSTGPTEATDAEMFRLWSKTKFSMVDEQTTTHLRTLNTKAVLLVGLEVRPSPISRPPTNLSTRPMYAYNNRVWTC